MYSLGLDIGCTNLKAAAVCADGERIERSSVTTPEDPESLVAAVRSVLDGHTTGWGEPPRSLGLSAPGLAARDGRAIVWMEGRNEAVVGLDWTAALGRRVWVLNDGHAATLGEAWLGAADGKRHVLLLTLGTGVGGGILADGRLLLGSSGRAGHVGHISLDPRGELDICRTPGSLESAVGDITVAERSGGRYDSTEELVAAVAAGNAPAKAVWERSMRDLAAGLASLINLVDPEVVVLGGGIAKAGDRLFEPLLAELDEVEWRPTGERVPVVAARLGEYAGALGAARHAMLEEGL